VPRPWSTSASLATTSTGSELRNTAVAAQSTTSLPIANSLTTTTATNTGPVDEVTPWELSPGPEDYNAAAPPSPTRGNNKKFTSLFKSKYESSKHTGSINSPDSPNVTQLPDIPMDLLATYGKEGIPPIALQRPVALSIKSNSQQSERSLAGSSKQQPQTQGGFKWSRPGSKGGKDRKDSTSSSNAGVGERTRQLPLTGPVEEVAPWEMDPPLEDGVEKTITNRAVKRISVTSSPPMSPTIEMWKAQKSAELVKGSRGDGREDGRSSSSALPLSRARADSVAANSEAGSMVNGERTQASTKGDEKAARVSYSRDGSGNKLSRGRSLTGQTATSSKPSLVRPASSSAVSAGHGGAESIISIMNKAQMEEVLPWELYPIPKPIQRSITAPSGMMMTTEERERDRKTVRVFFLNLLSCLFLFGWHVGAFWSVMYSGVVDMSVQLSVTVTCCYSAHDCGVRA